MGLDGVELLLEVEDTFEISISDSDASHIRTVGDLYGIIRKRLGERTSEQCLTARAFYRLRRAFMQTTGCRRNQVHPAWPLEEALPRRNRRQQWRTLAGELGLKLPELRRPPWLVRSMVCAVVAVFAAGLIARRLCSSPTGQQLLVALPVIIACAVILTRPMATVVPECRNVGDLAKAVLRDNFSALSGAKCASASDQDIWNSLVGIISDELGVPASDIEAETRFVEDLNVG